MCNTKYLKISKTANLQAVKTTYCSSLSVFTVNNIPSGAKKHCESTEPESRQMAIMFFFHFLFFFFLFFFFFFFFRQASSNLCDSITMIFTQNSSIFHWAVHQPIALYRFEVSLGGSNCSLKNHSFQCNFFFSSSVCMYTNHLAMKLKCNYYTRLLN